MPVKKPTMIMKPQKRVPKIRPPELSNHPASITEVTTPRMSITGKRALTGKR
jgi:hypothetical protein